MTMIWYQCPIKQYVSITNFLLMVHADDYVFDWKYWHQHQEQKRL